MDLKHAMRMAQAKRGKARVEHPFARYSNLGQLLCAVCNTVVKDEAMWTAHLGGRQHKEVVEGLKARKAQLAEKEAAPPRPTAAAPQQSAKASVAVAAGLPANFFDGEQPAKKPKTAPRKPLAAAPAQVAPPNKTPPAPLPTRMVGLVGYGSDSDEEEKKPALPKGFFADEKKDAEARGEAPKVDIDTGFKEFQKQMEEEEKAAEMVREEEEVDEAEEKRLFMEFEQQQNLARVEALKKQLAKRARRGGGGGGQGGGAGAQAAEGGVKSEATADPKEDGGAGEGSDSDDDFDEGALLDWRSKGV